MIIFINDQSSNRVIEKSLFCAAISLHFDIKDLTSDLTVPAAPKTNINTKTVMNVTFDHYSHEFKVPGTKSLPELTTNNTR